jgi:RNA 2',3'-cyclic 3'-phosphodiesterase
MNPGIGALPDAYRLFIAVPVPQPVKDAIEGTQDGLRRALSGDRVRWAGRAQFHLTLKFLGNVELRHLDALTQALRLACEGFGMLHLRAGGIGVFPEPRRPRVIWAGVHDTRERLPQLQRTVESAVAEFTTEKPERAFTGHITLGRCQTIKRRHVERLATLVAATDKKLFGDWTAECVELVRSESGPGGSRYTTLATVPLAAVNASDGRPSETAGRADRA